MQLLQIHGRTSRSMDPRLECHPSLQAPVCHRRLVHSKPAHRHKLPLRSGPLTQINPGSLPWPVNHILLYQTESSTQPDSHARRLGRLHPARRILEHQAAGWVGCRLPQRGGLQKYFGGRLAVADLVACSGSRGWVGSSGLSAPKDMLAWLGHCSPAHLYTPQMHGLSKRAQVAPAHQPVTRWLNSANKSPCSVVFRL